MAEVDVQSVLNEAYRRLNEDTRRLRTLEERTDLMEGRINGIENNLLRMEEEFRKRFDNVGSSVKALEEGMMKTDNEITKLSKLMEKTARKSEVDEIKNLMDLYNPFKKK